MRSSLGVISSSEAVKRNVSPIDEVESCLINCKGRGGETHSAICLACEDLGWYILLVGTHSWLVHTPGKYTLLVSTYSWLVHTPG